MDIAFIKQYIPMYVEAGKLTLGIAFLGILFSLLIGFAASLILYYKVPLWRRVVQIYVELSRNTPLLVQLFFLYFGLPKLGIRFSSELCGVIGLSFPPYKRFKKNLPKAWDCLKDRLCVTSFSRKPYRFPFRLSWQI